MDLQDIYRTFCSSTKDIPSSLYLIELSPKWTTYLDTKGVSKDIETQNNPLRAALIRVDSNNNRKLKNSWEQNESSERKIGQDRT